MPAAPQPARGLRVRGGGAVAAVGPPLRKAPPPLPGRGRRGGGGSGGEHVFSEAGDCRLLHGEPAAGAGRLPGAAQPGPGPERAGGASLRGDPGRIKTKTSHIKAT